MTKVNKSALSEGRYQEYEASPVFDASVISYPLKSIPLFHYEAKVTRREDKAFVSISAKGKLEVFDSRDNVPFIYPFSVKEEAFVLDEEDGESIGYIIPGSSFDLDALALDIVKSSLPLRLIRKGESTLKDEVGGVRILSDEEKAKEGSKGGIRIKGLDEE